jgi:hypothetical protein
MSDAKSKSSLGFLTVVEHEQFGLIGGYLVLNTAGRPLEFHCTAPVKPNRAQQILYGPTLEPYLFGEQIGQTLLAKTRLAPLVVFTDRAPALAVREHVDVPVGLVLSPDAATEPEHGDTPSGTHQPSERSQNWRLDAAHDRSRWVAFCVGRHRLAVAATAAEDRPVIEQRLAALAESFDLGEPFQRIREAIEEARRGGQ